MVEDIFVPGWAVTYNIKRDGSTARKLVFHFYSSEHGVFAAEALRQAITKYQPAPTTGPIPEESLVGMPKQDRYKVEGTDEDYVDITYRQMPWERFIGAMQWTIGKYFDRFGRKDDIVAEAYKIKDYANRFYEKVVLEADKRKKP
jgi:hypothetical protein